MAGASSILGKRKNAAAALPAEAPPSKRRTRRSQAPTPIFEDVNDENTPPSSDAITLLVKPTPARRGRPPKHRRPGDDAAAQQQQQKVEGRQRCTAAEARQITKTDAIKPLHKQLATPTTPRHHDVLGGVPPPPPTPVSTPRHKIQVAARLPLTPCTPRTPRTPSSGGSSAATTVYSAGRQLFARSAAPDQLVGRDAEVATVAEVLDEGIAARSGRCLYISGPPGTGKSALVSRVCEARAGQPGVRTATVNCMSVRSGAELCSKLVGALDANAPATRAGLQALVFPPANDPAVFVVALDEMDQLLAIDLDLLYALVEWALDPASRLVLIGIANALDLTDRCLPRLQARRLMPRRLQVAPYTAPQIVAVLTARLQSLAPDAESVPLVHPAALTLCAKKVAAQTGDLRKAFDLVRRIIGVVEAETLAATAAAAAASDAASPLSENPNLASPSGTPSRRAAAAAIVAPTPVDPLAHLTPCTAPRATVGHAARIAAAAFHHGTPQRLRALNVQQKAALCALRALEKQRAAAATGVSSAGLGARAPSKPPVPTIRALHTLYGQLCRREGTLAPLERGEFGEVVASLEGLGLVREPPVRTPRGRGTCGAPRREERAVASAVSEAELEAVLEGPVGGLLRGLLAGETA